MSNSIPIEYIQKRIYGIRGEKVMLDRDLAELYVVETKQLKRKMKRNGKCLTEELRKRSTHPFFEES